MLYIVSVKRHSKQNVAHAAVQWYSWGLGLGRGGPSLCGDTLSSGLKDKLYS